MTPQIKSEILSTYDQIKIEGKLEGSLEGKLEGKIEAKSEIVLNLHDMGMDIEFRFQFSVPVPKALGIRFGIAIKMSSFCK